MDTSVPPLKHQDCGRAEGEPCSVLTRLPRARSGGHGHRSWRVGLWVGVCKCQHLTPEDSGVDDRHQRQGRTAAMTPRTHSPLRSFRQPSAPANPPLLAPNNYQRHHMAATGLPFPLELIGIFCSYTSFLQETVVSARSRFPALRPAELSCEQVQPPRGRAHWNGEPRRRDRSAAAPPERAGSRPPPISPAPGSYPWGVRLWRPCPTCVLGAHAGSLGPSPGAGTWN